MRKHFHILSICILAFAAQSTAQSLADGIYMPKRVVCAGVIYQHDAWNQYYEGTLLRTNGNIGTVTTRATMAMANYGITDKLNVIAMLPWVKTQASAGSLAGQQGVQDLTLGVKYQPIQFTLGGAKLSPSLIAGVSTPVTNYVADYLPLAIGMHSRTAFGRALVHYLHDNGLSATAYGTYIGRGVVTLDRNSYFTTHLIESNQVSMPSVAQAGVRLGYYKYRFQAEALCETTKCVSGNDIRRQDMPFLTNKMEASRVGMFVAYRIKPMRDLQVVAGANQTLSGRNVGKAFTWSVGVMRAFGTATETLKK